MIEGQSPIVQALLGTFFTWFLTFIGACIAIFIQGNQRALLDCSLGFAAGVMLAASYWSLLEPAIAIAQELGSWPVIPVATGIVAGAAFVGGADVWLGDGVATWLQGDNRVSSDSDSSVRVTDIQSTEVTLENGDMELRRRINTSSVSRDQGNIPDSKAKPMLSATSWRRLVLMIIAVTVHNFPEGLVVGVGFGAIGSNPHSTFSSARNLALAIGLQNFPEGLAVALPLKAAGFSNALAIWYGQLSGMVEPVAGLLGALLAAYMFPVLPYALAFAAGAMIYVVLDDIIPEAHSHGNGKLASCGAVLGFIVMMVLDVTFG